MGYELVPITLAEANAFVAMKHRHHKPVVGSKFQLGVAFGGEIVGVAIAGRPVARALDDGWTLEVNRTCTDGHPNVNSMLYGAVARAAFAMGYRKVITYTLRSESGISLRAAGWRVVAEITGREWDTPSRPRVDQGGAQLEAKLRWESSPQLARSRVSNSEQLSLDLGFFDGEGCVNLTAAGQRRKSCRRDLAPRGPQRTYRVVRAQMLLGNTDLPVLEWLQARWGGQIYVKRDKRELRPQWTWSLLENRLLPFLDDIEPYLKIKAPQVLNAQAFIRLKLQRRKHSRFSPEERSALLPFLKVHQDLELDKRPHARGRKRPA